MNVRHCTWLGYRPPRPAGETGGRYHLGELWRSTFHVTKESIRETAGIDGIGRENRGIIGIQRDKYKINI